MGLEPTRLVAVVAGSFVVLLQTVLQHSEGGWDFFWVWAFIISGAGLAISMVALCSELKDQSGSPEIRQRATVLMLALVWAAGAIPLTAKRPYTESGNGYFGIWVALIGSWMMFVADREDLKAAFSGLAEGTSKAFALLALAGVTLFLQTAWSCATEEAGWCNANAAWLLVCSGVSSVICGALLSAQIAEKLRPQLRFISLFFCAWWAGAVVATFEEPYQRSYANGYFSCWAAALASLWLLESSWGMTLSENVLSRASEASGGAPGEVIGLLVASLVTLTAAAVDCGEAACVDCGEERTCSSLEIWAIFCSAVSLAACFAVILFTINGGWVTAGATTQRIATFLLVWWLFGTGFMTFVNPFAHVGNGYFAAWAALAAACLLALKHVPAIADRLGGDHGAYGMYIGACLVASAVLTVQAMWDCAEGTCSGAQVWAILCGIGSLLVCLAVSFKFDALESQFKYITIGLFSWWSLGVLFLTFRGTYMHPGSLGDWRAEKQQAGNAYFASWIAWTASGRAMLQHLAQQFPQLRGYADMDLGNVASTGAPAANSTSPPLQETPTVFGSPAVRDEEGADGKGEQPTGAATAPGFDTMAPQFENKFEDSISFETPTFTSDQGAPAASFAIDDGPEDGPEHSADELPHADSRV